mmetsp:Transcript_32988/g.79786  ORF Transcript_32988/g.79786 Transcript_32988/m.79786 type:complete len:183 (+) Transcript_32988:991-1539(+)
MRYNDANIQSLSSYIALSLYYQYQRTDGTSTVDDITGMVTISSVGRCVGSNPDYSAWSFAGPLLAFHVLLMVSTNVLLYKVKSISDRYQERKYVGLASILMFEILIVGIPVFIAVSDSTVAVFVVLTGLITLADISAYRRFATSVQIRHMNLMNFVFFHPKVFCVAYSCPRLCFRKKGWTQE